MSEPENLIGELEPIGDTNVAPGVGVAAIAMNMALKFHDITTVQDGTLYQQYKLEGKNLTGLHLDYVFETAMRIEAHLMNGPNRLSTPVLGIITEALNDPAEEPVEPETPAHD